MTPNLYDHQKEFYESAANGYTGFNELIVSNATPLIDLKSIYGVSNLRDRVTTTGSGAVTTERGLYKVSTGATASSTAKLSSVEFGRYVAGFESTAGVGVLLSRLPTGNEVGRWGYYDTNNGFGFGVDASGLFTFIRSGGVERVHRQPEWFNSYSVNLDTLNIYRIPFRWYGSGPAKYEVSGTDSDGNAELVTIDFFEAVAGQPLTENPNLPITVEVTNGGDATDFALFVGGRQFFVQGDYKPNRRITEQHRFEVSVGTTPIPLVSWRQKAGFESVSVKLEGQIVIASGANVHYTVRVGGTLTGANFIAPDLISPSETALEFDSAATAISGGQKIFAGLIASGSGNAAGSSSQTAPELDIPKDQILTLVARTISGTATVSAVLKAREEW